MKRQHEYESPYLPTFTISISPENLLCALMTRFRFFWLLMLVACDGPKPPAPVEISAEVEEARRLLSEAGFPQGKNFPKLELLYNTAEWHKKIAAAVQEMWRARLGITVELRNAEWRVYLDLVAKADYDIARRGYIGEYIDPESLLSLFLSDNLWNSTGWSSPEYDRRIAASDREADPSKRFAQLAEAERLLLREAPVAPIFHYVSHNLIKPFIKGVTSNPRDMHPLQGVTLEGPGRPDDGVLIFNAGEEPHSLDPAISDDIAGLKILMHLFEGLFNYHPRDASPVPAAAERWDVSADGRTYTFHLRPARWSNGDPVTAGDFVHAWRRVVNPKTPTRYKERMFVIRNARAASRGEAPLDSIGVRAKDDRTLVVELEHPAPYFPQLLCLNLFYPVHRATVEKYGDRWTDPEHMVHNGPYRLVSWKMNDRKLFEKNPRYRAADNVKLDKFVFLSTPDDATAFRMYESGQCHWLYRIPGEVMDRVKGRPDHLVGPYHGSYFYVFNVRKKPLDDPRVRRALSLAIDREKITKYILRGGEAPAHRLTPLLYPAYDLK
ncbi:MAG: hypothetical protein HY716_14610 [Planctomycetes bacterium]|nr:hypothetical protein [Planctomycetota bacterium]